MVGLLVLDALRVGAEKARGNWYLGQRLFFDAFRGRVAARERRLRPTRGVRLGRLSGAVALVSACGGVAANWRLVSEISHKIWEAGRRSALPFGGFRRAGLKREVITPRPITPTID